MAEARCARDLGEVVVRTILTILAVLISLPVAFWAAVTFGLGHVRVFPYRLEAVNHLLFILLLVGIPAGVGVGVHSALRSLARKPVKSRPAQPTVNPTREAVLSAVDRQFAAHDRAEALRLLEQYGSESHERERERVQLAIVTLSKGELAAVADLVRAAKQDYRDVLYWLTKTP